MFVRYAIIGEAVVAAGGKWNLLGRFNLLFVRQFPAVHGQLGLLLRIEGDHREIGQHKLRVEFVDETGQSLERAELDFEFKQPTLPGFPVEFDVGMQMSNLRLPSPGNYDFVIRVDGKYLDSAPLYVRDVRDHPQVGGGQKKPNA